MEGIHACARQGVGRGVGVGAVVHPQLSMHDSMALPLRAACCCIISSAGFAMNLNILMKLLAVIATVQLCASAEWTKRQALGIDRCWGASHPLSPRSGSKRHWHTIIQTFPIGFRRKNAAPHSTKTLSAGREILIFSCACPHMPDLAGCVPSSPNIRIRKTPLIV